MFRRGKLNFLYSKDDRIKVINERINLTEKHVEQMCSTFAACARKLAKYRDASDELAKSFKAYADEEEMNESLSEGLKNITNAVTIMGDYTDLNVQRLEMKIVNELARYESKCKNARDHLRTAVIARDKEVLKQRHMVEIKSKFTANNSAADSELVKSKLEVNRTNKEIDEIINNFEKHKLDDLKVLLTDFILISIKYHTKVLEVLSASYYDITNIDEKYDFVEFQKLMKTKEEPSARKLALKKGLRSQSMDSLNRDELLSPMKRRGRITRSTKNLDAKRSDDDEDDDDDEEEDDDDDDEDEENETEDEEEDGVVDDIDNEDEEEPSEADSGSASDDEPDVNDNDAMPVAMKRKNTQQVDLKKHKLKDQTFKAVAAAHAFNQKTTNKYRPFSVKAHGANNGSGGSKMGVSPRTKPHFSSTYDVDNTSDDGDNTNNNKDRRLVTVVESKKK